uniref:J domain-containing protein n=1 Tax=Macrostomum lignano TaxID=282301 RepID=A0A1I8H9S1_9PLAT
LIFSVFNELLTKCALNCNALLQISSMKICQVQFHTGFVREDFDRLNFTKCELDFLDTDDKYSSDFKLSLDLVVSPQDKPLVDGPPPWDGFQARGLKPRLLVSEDEELAKLRADFMRDGEAPPLASPVSSQDSPLADNEPAAPAAAAAAAAAAAPPKPQREGGSSFFDTLDWQHLEEPAPSAQPPISEPQQQRDDGPRDYEAEALRAAHREAERDRAEAEAERRRRLSGGGSGNFCPPEEPHRQADLEQSAALNDVSAGVADLLGFGGGGGGGGSNGGLSPAASSASLRQTQSNADLLSDLFSSAPAPAAASAGTTATPPPKAPYVVDDFFGGPNFTGAGHGNFVGAAQNQRKEPRSLHEMRHQARAQSMDPERAKVEAWVAGKERNVRGLLCSLHTVVWEGCRWTQVSMADLVSGDQVKKVYRKACLAVHPDKWAGTQHEAFSKLVFVELNDAWSAFEESGMKSLY